MFVMNICALFLFVEITLGQTTIRKNPLLSRKKRYLAFPEGSNFVITMSAVSNLLRRPTPGVEWKLLGEMDVPFPLPDSSVFLKKKKKMHLKQRRDIYKGLEVALNGNGFNGTACVNRMICEAQNLAPIKDSSLARHIIQTIFSYYEDIDDYGRSSCNNYSIEDCELPLLHYILGALSAS